MTATDGLTARGRRTRGRLLGAGEADLLEHGRLDVTRVARRADASLGLLYRYFAGKDALVTAIVDRFYDRYEDAVFAEPTQPEVGWYVQERARLEREVAFLLTDPLAAAIVGAAPQEPAAALADAGRLQRHIDMAARNIRHGQRRGEVDDAVDPDLAAAGFIGGLRAIVTAAHRRPRPATSQQVTELVWQLGGALIPPRTRPSTPEGRRGTSR